MRISCFPPPLDGNPYQRLLYTHLEREGFRLVRDPSIDDGWLRLRWLWRRRRSVGVLHLHWPQGLWRHDAGRRLAKPLSWVKLFAFAAKLAAARALGYRIVWTVHQIDPHERTEGRLDRAGARVLAAASQLLLAHDEETAAATRALVRRRTDRVRVVPHGNYIGVYPAGRARETVRRELGLGPETVAFLSFGELRGYKGVQALLDAFAAAQLNDAALIVAGRAVDPATIEAVRAAAAADPRVVPLLGFVPDDRVAELFAAADVAVLARRPGTSGSLVLALSQGLPVIAPRTPAYSELLGHGRAGWLFDLDRPDDLIGALQAAAAATDRDARRDAALAQAQGLDWAPIAARVAAHLRSAPYRGVAGKLTRAEALEISP